MTNHKETSDNWQKKMTKANHNLGDGLIPASAREKFFHGQTNSQLDIPTTSSQPTVNYAANGSQPESSSSRWRVPLPIWSIWGMLIVLFSGSLGFTAMSMLLRLPSTPDCHKLVLPISSASTRLSCAQTAAEQGTVDGILEAMDLVDNLADDHPLKPEINRLMAEWSVDLLKYGEEKFQTGDLEGAIATARQVPEDTEAYQLVEEQIERWQETWSKAESYYQAAEKNLKSSKWNLAFREAVRLTYVRNKYWARVKYDEMVANINQGRKDSAKLDKAYISMRKGGVDNLIESIKLAKVIKSTSFAYQEATDLINDAGKKLLEIAYKAVDSRNWALVSKAANAIPSSLDAQDEVNDLNYLSNAGSRAEIATVSSLEAAILEAGKIDSDSPLYGKTQSLIGRWQLEIEDVTYLAKARDLAVPGNTNDLRAAISQASNIPRNNPRYQEAQREISGWRRQIQLAEDRPILDRAVQLASYNSGVASLQDAVNEASRISSGRPLYREAQGKISQWNTTIERQQDQPFLNQAERLASSGNWVAAIEAAQRIQPGRSLYSEAQSKVRVWSKEVQARQNLQRAYGLANNRTPETLVQAIRTARQIPDATSVSRERNQVVNDWSNQILVIARSLASESRWKEAITVAKMVPSGTAAYSTARSNINQWRAIIAPPVIVPPPAVTPPTPEIESSVPEVSVPEERLELIDSSSVPKKIEVVETSQ